jgi:hypothetical protein
VALLLALIAIGEVVLLVLVLTANQPGTHLLPSHSSLNTLFRAWR